MMKSVHELTMERALSQNHRREQEQRSEGDVEKEERDAAREWLRHVEAGRIGEN